MDYGRLFEWGIVVAFLGFILYAAFIIKGEKNTYLKEAFPFSFYHFQFLIPKWWTLTSKDSTFLRFERTDTRYDWFAQFFWHSLTNIDQDIKEILICEIESRHIKFDPDSTDILTPGFFKQNDQVNEQELEIVRIEGTATQRGEERIYYDAFVIKDRKRNGYLYAENHSSILSGPIEGPYFEEVMNNFQIKT